MAIAMAMAIVFRSCCNGDGAMETPAIDQAIAMAQGQGHWGTGAGATATATAMAMGQWQPSIVFYIAAQNVENSGC
jgi:hypothetical protein